MELEMRTRNHSDGFSMVELLVASVLFTMTVLGILPLFMAAGTSNVVANDSTKAANFARSQLEEFQQLPFNSAQLVPNADDPLVEYYSVESHEWKPGEPPGDGSDPGTWLRTTTVRQFNISALDDGTIDPDTEALDAGADPAWVHLKQVSVELRSLRESGILGPAQVITFNLMKAN